MERSLREEDLMRIIIVGCGKVGHTLAEHLSNENHEVTMIDVNSQTLQDAIGILDVSGVVGNGTSYRTQVEAGVEEADLLIAVTDRDEINLLSCLIAKKAGKCQTIARVRNPEYYEEINFIKEELGLSMSINPEWAAASEIARLIHYPSAFEVDTFAKGKVNLLRIQIPEGSVLDHMKLMEFPSKVSRDVLICIVERQDEVIIPNGSFELLEGDMISIILPMEKAFHFFRQIGIQTKPIKNVLIAGGGTISYYLAKQLEKSKVKTKIIEADRKRCEDLSEALPDTMIIHGDATDKQLLLEEGIVEVDAMAALTNLDEENIMLSLYAHQVSSAKKTMTKINKINFEEVIRELPIGSMICPKNITAEYIIRYVRSMQNSFNSSNVEALYRMANGRVEALEFKVGENAKVIRKPLMELSLKDNLLICSISRRGIILTPGGKDQILPGDGVIVVTTHKGLNGIDDIIRD